MDNPRGLPIPLLIRRAVRLRCPQCGRGKLFKSYLKTVDACADCGASFKGIRADDGPAWLTILVVCHIMVPALIAIKTFQTWPDRIALPLWLAAAAVLTLVLLPCAKAVFIAILWRQKRSKAVRDSTPVAD